MTYLLWKQSCRGPSTSDTHCVTAPPELYSYTALYSALQRSTALYSALQLYSSTALYSLDPLQQTSAHLPTPRTFAPCAWAPEHTYIPSPISCSWQSFVAISRCLVVQQIPPYPLFASRLRRERIPTYPLARDPNYTYPPPV